MCFFFIFAIAGIIAFLAASFNWSWFFTAQYVVKLYGRQKDRIIYGALGLVLILMAVYFYLNTPTS